MTAPSCMRARSPFAPEVPRVDRLGPSPLSLTPSPSDVNDWAHVHSSRTRSLLRAALAAALIAAGALLAVPLGPVPVTLQVLVVAVVTLVLSPGEALAAVALYLLLGAFGAPVFSGGSAGLGVLTGPTGGFLLGFLLGAPLGAIVRRTVNPAAAGSPWRRALGDTLGLAVLLAVTYLVGLLVFAAVTGRSAPNAFAIAVAPFLLVDLCKAILALLVARPLRAAGLADG